MPQSSAPFIHGGDPAYAPPVLRAPSPSSSIGTDYGPDETSFEEKQKSQSEFVKGIQESLRLTDPRPEETIANKDPLLPKPKDAQEETSMFEAVMVNLRKQVQLLEEDHLFEQAILRGTLVTEQREQSSGDVDSIMRSMMNLSPNTAAGSTTQYTQAGNANVPGIADTTFGLSSSAQPSTPMFNLPAVPESNGIAIVAGRRSTRLKVKSRRP